MSPFDRDALIRALRADQAGEGDFPEFPDAAWRADVIGYRVDFAARTCTCHGADDESYVETCPPVESPPFD